MDVTEHLAEVLGAEDVRELGGGHQSRAFEVVLRSGAAAVAKLLDATMVDRRELDARLDVVVALADLDPRVCRPLAVGDQLVTDLALADGHHAWVVCVERADGVAPEPSDPADADRMGTALAQLHASLRRLPAAPLPLVAALRRAPPDVVSTGGATQLLHGDFNAGNLRRAGDRLRIFDLDDCGYGPTAFDVANALYMVRFDAVVHRTPGIYESFRGSFVPAYVRACDRPVAAEVVDRFIDLRVDALRGWIDDLDTAPIGIRTASPDWLATLRAFVDGAYDDPARLSPRPADRSVHRESGRSDEDGAEQ